MTEAQRIRAGEYSLEHLNAYITLKKYAFRYWFDFQERYSAHHFKLQIQ